MGSGPKISGKPHRNDWLHGWLIENNIENESEAQKAAKSPQMLADLIDRAQAQNTEPIENFSGRSIAAGRSMDLTSYLSCGHPDCMTKQVDRLFSRVWHYFDKIAISGPDTHTFLEMVEECGEGSRTLANAIPELSRPIFHIREIGADGMVTWVSKPPACQVHWMEYGELKDYHLPKKAHYLIESRLLEEGTIRLEKRKSETRLVLNHQDLVYGNKSKRLEDLQQWKRKGESLEAALARLTVDEYWAAAASDIYAARSMGLPLGLGITLEAQMASMKRDAVSPSEVAFNLILPVVDGLPVKELIALRESEGDAFTDFRDSLTRAIKDQLAGAGGSIESVGNLANELQSDVIDPALHRIEHRLRAAEGLLKKNYRYNIAIAGLATICGIFTSPDIATAVAAVALTGTGMVEAQYASEKRDISLEDMYFLWKAKEYRENKSIQSKRPKQKRKR